MKDAFLSYSRRDKEFADRLIRALQERNISVWLDRHDLRGGQDWQQMIRDAIVGSNAFVLILTPNCADSENIADELSMAKHHKRAIVPVMAETCELPARMEYSLTRLQIIDFAGSGFDTGLNALVEALQPGSQHDPPPPRQPEPPRPKAQPPPPPPPLSPQQLAQMLFGRWNIQIASPVIGPATLLLNLYPNGGFDGQLMSGVGMMNINGGWQITFDGQLIAQGQQMIGWIRSPYYAAVRFTMVTPSALAGFTAAGEQVTWTRVG